MRIHFTRFSVKCTRIILIVANYQVVYCQGYIPHCYNQPPYQDEPTNHAADDEVQRKQGNPATHGVSTWYKPKPHPMEANGKPAEYPEPQIVNRAILHTGGFEDADQHGHTNYGYYALFEKQIDNFFPRHGIHLPESIITSVDLGGANNLRTMPIPQTFPRPFRTQRILHPRCTPRPRCSRFSAGRRTHSPGSAPGAWR